MRAQFAKLHKLRVTLPAVARELHGQLGGRLLDPAQTDEPLTDAGGFKLDDKFVARWICRRRGAARAGPDTVQLPNANGSGRAVALRAGDPFELPDRRRPPARAREPRCPLNLYC